MCLRDWLINDPEKRFLNDLQSILQSTYPPLSTWRGEAKRVIPSTVEPERENKNKKFVILEC